MARSIHAKQNSLMLELGVKFLISYFIGSLMGAMIVGKLRGGVDIRTMGSGNAGGTNALRTQGLGFAIGVVLIDVGKGAIGAGVVPGLAIPFVPADPEISRQWLMLCCGAAAVFGHVWPIFHRFRGLVWVAVLVMSGYVGLATMAAAIAVPVLVAITRLPEDQPLFIYCVVMAGYIVRWHRINVQRMRDGTEHRNTKLMIFSSKRKTGEDEQA
jgi:glycerol-3-phosphate acyltransferase PlsY